MANQAKCSIEWCDNVVTSRGYGKYRKVCRSHHCKKYGISTMPWRRRNKAKFKNAVCAICGWEGVCDRHRVVHGKDGGKYEAGNVISICPNDHRMLHLGLLKLK